jgi:HlyD family secretion protein
MKALNGIRRVPASRLVLTAVIATASLVTWAVHAADDKVTEKPSDKASDKKSAAKPALTVTLTQTQRATLATGVQANGNIAAWQEAIVGAEANGARLAEVRVNVGDVVKRGQVLATFAPEMIQADLAQSKATMAEAEATLAEATANAQRARELQASGALSAQQINQYLTGERTAQARVQALRAASKVQQLRLAQTQVLAPDSGVISARSATVGAVVPAGMELFKLIRQGRLEWRAEVAANELSQLKPGMVARVTTAGGATVNGTVRMVAPTVDANTRNGLVFVDLPQPGPAKSGMFARGEFDIGSSAALTLPQSAVLLRDGFTYVFKVAGDNKVVQAKVTVGRRVGDRIEVTAGVEPTARVVASGGAFLADGDTVKVVDSGVAAAPAAKAAAPQ